MRQCKFAVNIFPEKAEKNDKKRGLLQNLKALQQTFSIFFSSML